ncbi:MAG: hypothetical protein KME60_28690 [Cyanomargarita calcarea GSE-NOS-MK-12-04C]|uniref:Uncharacterized protein n=1 Tax=Cyanomargarita calcarea GSE-NOS-MK-12-04C TaxID=2839659 RepID=A0A951UW17_9CYAN|nr:hypothetical protein [Cyanomargarita calcarea GSE-NOS-MK-12-04C]
MYFIYLQSAVSAFFGRRLSAEVVKTEVLKESTERLEQVVKQRTFQLEAAKLIAEAANRVKEFSPTS